MAHVCVWHDSFECVKCLRPVYNITHSHVWHDSSMYVAQLIRMCVMAQACVQHSTCNTLQHSVTLCNTLQRTANSATLCKTLQHSATLCNTPQHSAQACVQHSTCSSQACTHKWTSFKYPPPLPSSAPPYFELGRGIYSNASWHTYECAISRYVEQCCLLVMLAVKRLCPKVARRIWNLWECYFFMRMPSFLWECHLFNENAICSTTMPFFYENAIFCVRMPFLLWECHLFCEKAIFFVRMPFFLCCCKTDMKIRVWQRLCCDCGNTLQHTATQRHKDPCLTVAVDTATLCNTLQHSATLCNTLQHSATHRRWLLTKYELRENDCDFALELCNTDMQIFKCLVSWIESMNVFIVLKCGHSYVRHDS